MLNIFNLFLFLFAIWSTLLLLSNHIAWSWAIFGIISAFLISCISYKLKLIDNKSQFPFLQTGFYSHFFMLYCTNFISSIKLIIVLAFGNNSNKAVIKSLKFSAAEVSNSLMIATINMNSGLLCIDCDDEKFLVYCVDQEYLKNCDFEKILKSLKNVNDDEI